MVRSASGSSPKKKQRVLRDGYPTIRQPVLIRAAVVMSRVPCDTAQELRPVVVAAEASWPGDGTGDDRRFIRRLHGVPPGALAAPDIAMLLVLVVFAPWIALWIAPYSPITALGRALDGSTQIEILNLLKQLGKMCVRVQVQIIDALTLPNVAGFLTLPPSPVATNVSARIRVFRAASLTRHHPVADDDLPPTQGGDLFVMG